MNTFTRVLVILALGFLMGLEASPAIKDHGTAEMQLVFSDQIRNLRMVTPILPDRIEGAYGQGDLGINFLATKTNDERLLSIQSLNGRELYMLIEDKKYITTSILNNRLVRRFDKTYLKQLRTAISSNQSNLRTLFTLAYSTQGDLNASEELMSAPEMMLLPNLAFLLGKELGYKGTTHPAALPLYVFGNALYQKQRAAARPLSQKPLLNAQFLPASLRFNRGCEEYPNPELDCHGMCGPGCECWDWVCGDCCFHDGCSLHDTFCRGNSWTDWYYCYVAFWDAFVLGGGCGTLLE